MHRYGGPEVLALESVALEPLAPGEVRIRSLFSAVNHSDLEIRAGNWPIQGSEPFPYVPGLEVIGDVVEVGETVAGVRAGDRVITMMQGLGGVRARRLGGYADHVTVAADAVAVVPEGVDPEAMGALGLAAVTAYEALRLLGQLDGRRVLVTGASGGVGSAAVGIARASGADVIGVVSRSDRADYVRSLGAESVIATAETSISDALPRHSIDGVLDTVAGPLFGPLVKSLTLGGRLSLVGAVAGSDVSFDAYDLPSGISLTGYSSEDLDGHALQEAVTSIAALVKDGRLEPPHRTRIPLSEAADAHRLLEGRGVEGRLLLTPDP